MAAIVFIGYNRRKIVNTLGVAAFVSAMSAVFSIIYRYVAGWSKFGSNISIPGNCHRND